MSTSPSITIYSNVGDLADATISIGNRIGKRQAAATPHAAAGWHAPGTVQARVSLTSKEPLEHQQYGVISSYA